MILRQPLHQRRRHQQQLAALTRNEISSHTRKCLKPGRRHRYSDSLVAKRSSSGRTGRSTPTSPKRSQTIKETSDESARPEYRHRLDLEPQHWSAVCRRIAGVRVVVTMWPNPCSVTSTGTAKRGRRIHSRLSEVWRTASGTGRTRSACENASPSVPDGRRRAVGDAVRLQRRRSPR